MSELGALVVLSQEAAPEPFLLQWWVMPAVVGVMFYFIMILPERRKRKQASQMMDNLKKNDRVVTIGGIYGVVVNVQRESAEVTIRVDEGTNSRLRVRRSAISEVLTEESDEKKDAS